MGFQNNSYAKVWEVRRISDTLTSVRISISTKDKQSGEYIQRFGGFVSFLGTACAAKAAGLKQGDRVHLERVDVENRYDKESGKVYTNFNVWEFSMADDGNLRSAKPVDSGEPPEVDFGDDRNLPF